MKRLIVLALAGGLFLSGTSGCGQTATRFDLPTGRLLLGAQRVPLRVEIAETAAARGRGLMDRTSLPPDRGMVFLFDTPLNATFHMKDTLIPLSIAFWDQAGRIVTILEMTPCRSEPCPNYSPGRSIVGAVEANRGFFIAHGIKVGDRVELER